MSKKGKKESIKKVPFYPQEVTDAFLAFPNPIQPLIPPPERIPGRFKNFNQNDKWISAATNWFYFGLVDDAEFWAVDADPPINPELAFRHIWAILGSFEIKHEVKVAVVAYLMSIWLKQPPEAKKAR